MPHSMARFARSWTGRRVRLNGDKLRLLLVDDNRNGVEALAAWMALEDRDCRIALGGREAVTTAFAWIPHIVLMDISMPECNGFQAAQSLRENPRTEDTTIIAFTALDENEVRGRGTGREFDAYCQKGHATRDLLWLIASLMG